MRSTGLTSNVSPCGIHPSTIIVFLLAIKLIVVIDTSGQQ